MGLNASSTVTPTQSVIQVATLVLPSEKRTLTANFTYNMDWLTKNVSTLKGFHDLGKKYHTMLILFSKVDLVLQRNNFQLAEELHWIRN